MISEIESSDIKASYTVSRVLWTLFDTIFAGDDEEDALNFYDKELLDDILRFGTIAEVARRKGEPYQNVRIKVAQNLERLEKKIKWIEIKAHQLSHDLENANSLLNVKDKKLNEQKLQLIEKVAFIRQLQVMLSEERKKHLEWREKEKEWEEKIDSLNKQLLASTQTINDLRHKSENAQVTKVHARQLKDSDSQLKKALAKLSKASEKEKALKSRISSLENLVEYYKKAKFSSNNEPTGNDPL